MASIVVYATVVRKRAVLGGLGYIAGTLPGGLVTINGSPGARELEIRHRITRLVVAVTFSHSDGTYQVDDLDPAEEFDVIARDWARVYNDVIVSRVRPKPY